MQKAKIETVIVLKSEEIKKTNVVCLTVSNFKDTEANFFFNGVKRVLPAVDKDSKVPTSPFVMSAEGYPFDIDLNFYENNSNIVVDYAYLVNEKNQKC